MIRRAIHPRHFLPAVFTLTLAFSLFTATTANRVAAEDLAQATPLPWSCEDPATPVAASPMAGTPVTSTGDGERDDTTATGEIEFDQLYIDLMIPHHESLIALAQAAIPVLTDSRLIVLAHTIVDEQAAGAEQLREWRESWYGDPEPAGDESSVMSALESMPVASMDEMQRAMDPAWQVETFCAADNPDVAFPDQVIQHHQTAIEASQIALNEAGHSELGDFANRLIADQQTRIDQLNEIRAEHEGVATPVD